MYRFNNDYNRGAHPAILEILNDTNKMSYAGYGLDVACERAASLIKKAAGVPKADVHFLVGGTQTNYTVISHALRPYESVLAPESGHINVHETGAVEHIGHKIETLPQKDGKISASQVDAKMTEIENSPVPEHITTPRMLYISYPTEFGTIYSKKELTDIYNACKKHKIYLFIDGARLGYGLTSPKCDLTFKEFAKLCDVFYIGGTKCGLLFGEAVVINNQELKACFRSSIKENGGMLAKGWLLGLQFATLFEDNLYFDICSKADIYAMKIKKAFKTKGIPSYIDSPTNQQFVIVTKAQAAKLAKNFIYEDEGAFDKNHLIIRFCTSWASEEEEVNALIEEINKL